MCTTGNHAQRFALTSALLIVLFAAGCWEEIRYTPTPEADSTAPAAAPTEEAESPAAPPAEPLAESPAEDQAPVDDARETESEPAALPPEERSEPQAAAPETPATPSPSPHEQLLAWRAASKWSLAAAALAKGLDATRYEPMQREAEQAAKELGLELPELPTADDAEERERVIIEALRTGGGAQLADSIAERCGEQAGAAARLAIGTHLLLLVYSPQDPEAPGRAAALRGSAEAAGIPAEAWEPLAKLVEGQAEYLSVRGAVFEMHRQVEEHFGGL